MDFSEIFSSQFAKFELSGSDLSMENNGPQSYISSEFQA
jgi:hypothetical protein